MAALAELEKPAPLHDIDLPHSHYAMRLIM